MLSFIHLKTPILFETPTIESQDIDNRIDWRIAEIMALAAMLARSHAQSPTGGSD